MKTNISNLYFEALRKKYESQISEAEANLSLYFNNERLAAIGEHSDLLTEHDKWIEILANATDKLQTLESVYKKITK